MLVNKIIEALNNIGIQTDYLTTQVDFNIKDVLEDSLNTICFFVELEDILDIDIPDELIISNCLESFEVFCQKVNELIDN